MLFFYFKYCAIMHASSKSDKSKLYISPGSVFIPLREIFDGGGDDYSPWYYDNR